jgi:DNA uptake protein ComE-like DNA-binding protein
MPRYYAVVRPTNPGNKDLAELLVEAGLARAKGIQIKIPGSPSLADFKRMEANAKQLKMGVYGGNKPPRADKPKSSREAFESKFSAATPSPAPDTEALVPEVDLGIADDIGAALAMPTLTTESKTTSINRSKPPTVTKSPESTENVIDINNASRIQLMKLPRIGEKTARAIIEARPFSSIEELQRVGNIGPTTFARLKGLVEVRN